MIDKLYKLVLPDFPSACGWGDKVWIFLSGWTMPVTLSVGFNWKNHEVIQTNLSVGQAVEEGSQRTGKREVSKTWTTVSETLKHTSFTLAFGTEAPVQQHTRLPLPWSFMSCNFLAKQDMLRMRGRQPELNLATDLYTTGTLCSSQLESGQPQRLLSSATHQAQTSDVEWVKGETFLLIFLRCKWSYR